MSTCTAHLNIKGGDFPCELEEDHYGLAHSSKTAAAIWGPVPIPPLERMAPYALWADVLSDDEIENIIKGRE